MTRVRLDLFICMIITGALFVGIWFVGDKIGVLDGMFNIIGNIVDPTVDGVEVKRKTMERYIVKNVDKGNKQWLRNQEENVDKQRSEK